MAAAAPRPAGLRRDGARGRRRSRPPGGGSQPRGAARTSPLRRPGRRRPRSPCSSPRSPAPPRSTASCWPRPWSPWRSRRPRGRSWPRRPPGVGGRARGGAAAVAAVLVKQNLVDGCCSAAALVVLAVPVVGAGRAARVLGRPASVGARPGGHGGLDPPARHVARRGLVGVLPVPPARPRPAALAPGRAGRAASRGPARRDPGRRGGGPARPGGTAPRRDGPRRRASAPADGSGTRRTAPPLRGPRSSPFALTAAWAWSRSTSAAGGGCTTRSSSSCPSAWVSARHRPVAAGGGHWPRAGGGLSALAALVALGPVAMPGGRPDRRGAARGRPAGDTVVTVLGNADVTARAVCARRTPTCGCCPPRPSTRTCGCSRRRWRVLGPPRGSSTSAPRDRSWGRPARTCGPRCGPTTTAWRPSRAVVCGCATGCGGRPRACPAASDATGPARPGGRPGRWSSSPVTGAAAGGGWGRQVERDRPARSRQDRRVAAVADGHAARQVQAQPGAGGGAALLGPAEPVEGVVAELLGEAVAAVAHDQAQPALGVRRGDGDRRATVAQRVHQQVAQRHRAPAEVEQQGSAGLVGDVEHDVGAPRDPVVHHVLDELADVDGLALQRRPRAQLLQLEQRVGEPDQPLDLTLERGQGGVELLGAAAAVAHPLQLGAHHRERGAQLVGGVGEELALALGTGLDPCEQVVEGVPEPRELVVAVLGDGQAADLLGAGARGRPAVALDRVQRGARGAVADQAGADEGGEVRDEELEQELAQGLVVLAAADGGGHDAGAVRGGDPVGLDPEPAVRRRRQEAAEVVALAALGQHVADRAGVSRSGTALRSPPTRRPRRS